ncbi:hypothetical protein LTR86_005540 [Recurvomyces mirabilis]|nr:hypothetical protein LTR86_005540 [Recurvomyces mirabilis]
MRTWRNREMEMERRLTTDIVKLPTLSDQTQTSPNILDLAQRWRSFRLHALKTAPEAFAASHEIESQHGIEKTIERLSSSKATHFVALDSTSPHGDTSHTPKRLDVLEAPWVGTIVLLGPLTDAGSTRITATKDPFARVAASDHVTGIETSTFQPANDGAVKNEILHYHLNGIAARGRGLGLALIQAALIEAAHWAKASDSKGFKATILVDDYNTAARQLYEKAGFVVVGREVYEQQPRALVEDEKARTERVALLMEHLRVIESPVT